MLRVDGNVIRMPGTTDLEDLRNETGIRIKKGVYDTIGGFISTRIGEIPQSGAKFRIDGIDFTVIESDGRHIKTIEMNITESDAALEGGS